jgi:hypothetical protein
VLSGGDVVTVTRDDPRTRLDAQVEMEYLSALIGGTVDHTPSEAEKAKWRERQDTLLATWWPPEH